MLEVIPEPPAGVVGIGAHGRVTADAGDCHLLPPIGAPSVRGGWVGDGFEGALIDAIPAEDPDLCRTEGGDGVVIEAHEGGRADPSLAVGIE